MKRTGNLINKVENDQKDEQKNKQQKRKEMQVQKIILNGTNVIYLEDMK